MKNASLELIEIIQSVATEIYNKIKELKYDVVLRLHGLEYWGHCACIGFTKSGMLDDGIEKAIIAFEDDRISIWNGHCHTINVPYETPLTAILSYIVI